MFSSAQLDKTAEVVLITVETSTLMNSQSGVKTYRPYSLINYNCILYKNLNYISERVKSSYMYYAHNVIRTCIYTANTRQYKLPNVLTYILSFEWESEIWKHLRTPWTKISEPWFNALLQQYSNLTFSYWNRGRGSVYVQSIKIRKVLFNWICWPNQHFNFQNQEDYLVRGLDKAMQLRFLKGHGGPVIKACHR